jgi:hypothetical protein
MGSQMINQTFKHAKQHDILSYAILRGSKMHSENDSAKSNIQKR